MANTDSLNAINGSGIPNVSNDSTNFISPFKGKDHLRANTNLASTSFLESYLPNPIGQTVAQVVALPGVINQGVKVLLGNGEYAFISNNPGVGQVIKEHPLAYGSSGIVDSWISGHTTMTQTDQNKDINSNPLNTSNQTGVETHHKDLPVVGSTNLATESKENAITPQPSLVPVVANIPTHFRPNISTPISANPYEARSKTKQLTIAPTPGMLAADKSLNQKLNNIFSLSNSSTEKPRNQSNVGVTNIGGSDSQKEELNPASGSILSALNNSGSKGIKGL